MNKNELLEKLLKELKPLIKENNFDKVDKKIKNVFKKYEFREINGSNPKNNKEALILFIDAKRIEGCSNRSIKYYEVILNSFLNSIEKNYLVIETEDIRRYLSNYAKRNVSNVTLDNVRRIISTFFAWLESENYIIKSPTRRIHKIKIEKVIKETYNDETIELLRQYSMNIRNLAIIDFLLSTGVRVGELVKLNISDLNLESRECIVQGKGNKQRKVYFDAKTKLEIEQYIKSRNDKNIALFVSLFNPHDRLEISGVEIMLKKISKKIGIHNVHPHKFRRTLATRAIDKGMPIEQVQKMLGHAKIDTTLEYAMVDENNVKISHKKFLE